MAYRVTPKIRARAAEARETIVRAALELLTEGGYAAAGMHAVADRAGVATGTVYRHFPGKAELFAEVFRRICQQEIGVLTEAAGGPERPAVDRMSACVERFAGRALEQPTRAWALIAEPLDAEVEAERMLFRRAFRDLLAAILRDGVRRGELRPQDAEIVAAALVGALAEALVGPLAAGTPEQREGDALVTALVSFAIACVHVRPRQNTPARVAA